MNNDDMNAWHGTHRVYCIEMLHGVFAVFFPSLQQGFYPFFNRHFVWVLPYVGEPLCGIQFRDIRSTIVFSRFSVTLHFVVKQVENMARAISESFFKSLLVIPSWKQFRLGPGFRVGYTKGVGYRSCTDTVTYLFLGRLDGRIFWSVRCTNIRLADRGLKKTRSQSICSSNSSCNFVHGLLKDRMPKTLVYTWTAICS